MGWGWPEFLGDEEIDPWGGTSDGILGLLDAMEPKDSPFIKNAVRWLKSNQMADGGWAWLKHKSGVEPTSWVLMALVKAGENIKSQCIQDGISWLRRNQNPDGGWGYWKDQPSRVYATSVALKALQSCGLRSEDPTVADGIEWVKKSKNKDHGWGYLKNDDRSNVASTAHALLALIACGMNPTSLIIREGVSWLYQHQNPDGSWDNTEEDSLVRTNGLHHLRTRHFCTPWATIALIEAQEYVFSSSIMKAVCHVMEIQDKNDGWWRWAFDFRPCTWTIYNGVHMLYMVSQKMDSIVTSIGLHQEIEEIKKSVEKISSDISTIKEATKTELIINLKKWVIWIGVSQIFISAGLLAIFLFLFGYYSNILSFLYMHYSELIIGIFLAILAAALSHYSRKRLARKNKS